MKPNDILNPEITTNRDFGLINDDPVTIVTSPGFCFIENKPALITRYANRKWHECELCGPLGAPSCEASYANHWDNPSPSIIERLVKWAKDSCSKCPNAHEVAHFICDCGERDHFSVFVFDQGKSEHKVAAIVCNYCNTTPWTDPGFNQLKEKKEAKIKKEKREQDSSTDGFLLEFSHKDHDNTRLGVLLFTEDHRPAMIRCTTCDTFYSVDERLER